MTKKLTAEQKKERKEARRQAKANPTVDLCQICAYEFDTCQAEGTEGWAIVKGRVTKCGTHVKVAPGKPAAAAPTPADADKPPQVDQDGPDQEESKETREPVPEDVLAEHRQYLKDIAAEEAWGNCGLCDTPLKRTAFNIERDAVRCNNKGCRNYRVPVKQIERAPRTLQERGLVNER